MDWTLEVVVVVPVSDVDRAKSFYAAADVYGAAASTSGSLTGVRGVAVARLIAGWHTAGMRLRDTIPAMPVLDVSASLAFYGDRLGFDDCGPARYSTRSRRTACRSRTSEHVSSRRWTVTATC